MTSMRFWEQPSQRRQRPSEPSLAITYMHGTGSYRGFCYDGKKPLSWDPRDMLVSDEDGRVRAVRPSLVCRSDSVTIRLLRDPEDPSHFYAVPRGVGAGEGTLSIEAQLHRETGSVDARVTFRRNNA